MFTSIIPLRGFWLFVFLGCALTVFPQHKKTMSVLFVGNSLTYSNDLPELFVELGKMDGVIIEAKAIVQPGYSLEDHWNQGRIQKMLGEEKFDILIGQQGPSALPESQVLLLEYASRLAAESRKHQTAFALYMVWPSAHRSFDMDHVITSYSQAAKQTGAVLCPAGLAWKKAWTADPSLPLYATDSFHPSLTGTVLAVMTIYAAIQEKSDLDFIRWEECSWRNSISKERMEKMKLAALQSVD